MTECTDVNKVNCTNNDESPYRSDHIVEIEIFAAVLLAMFGVFACFNICVRILFSPYDPSNVYPSNNNEDDEDGEDIVRVNIIEIVTTNIITDDCYISKYENDEKCAIINANVV